MLPPSVFVHTQAMHPKEYLHREEHIAKMMCVVLLFSDHLKTHLALCASARKPARKEKLLTLLNAINVLIT
jgi:hypothetical protein